MIHGVVEEEDVDAATIDAIEVVEVDGEEGIVATVELIIVRGDDGTLDIVDTVDIAEEVEIVKAADELSLVT